MKVKFLHKQYDAHGGKTIQKVYTHRGSYLDFEKQMCIAEIFLINDDLKCCKYMVT